MNEKQTSNRKDDIRRRYFTSLSIQLGLAAVFVCVLWFMSSQKNEKVPIERNTIHSESQSSRKEATIENLLALKETLELTSKQVKDLTDLKAKKDEKLGPLDKQLELAIEDFEAFMSSRGKKRTNMREIFNHSAPATNLGRRRRMLVESYSHQGMKLLSKKQNQLVYEMFSKLRAKSKTVKGLRMPNVTH